MIVCVYSYSKWVVWGLEDFCYLSSLGWKVVVALCEERGRLERKVIDNKYGIV